MAGHSKWANIKHRKARQDAVKGKIFTKIAKEIMVAVKQGGPDPEANFKLKLAIQKAKTNNLPNENISRAIQKAAGGSDTDNYEEISYEGYGPGGVAIMLEIVTDNRNRTASEIRYLFSRNGGNLGETGCVSWMFNRQGLILADLEGKDEEELILTAIEAGAEDIKIAEDTAEIIIKPDLLEVSRQRILDTGFIVKNAEVTMIPQNIVEVTDLEQAKKLLKLMDALEDHDDVQNAHANFDIPAELMEQLE